MTLLTALNIWLGIGALFLHFALKGAKRRGMPISWTVGLLAWVLWFIPLFAGVRGMLVRR